MTLAAAAGIVVAGVALAGAAFLLNRGEDDQSAAAETATPSSATVPAAESTASPSPHPGVDALQRTGDDEWQITHYHDGDTTNGPYGIFFMDTTSGDATGYQVISPDVASYYSYSAGRGNRLVFATGDGYTRMLDREEGRSWEWLQETLSVSAASGRYVLLNETQRISAEQQPNATTRFLLLDVDQITSPGTRPAAVASFDLPVEGRFSVTGAQLTADGAHAVIMVAQLDGRPPRDVYIVDLPGGDATVIATIAAEYQWVRSLELAPDEASFSFMQTRYPQLKDDPTQPGAVMASSYDWSGRLLARLDQEGATGPERVEFSPNGNYAIAESTIGTGGSGESPERWPVITVYERQNATSWAPLWRVKSATMVAGDNLEGSHWLADSSGFIANIEGPQDAVPGYPAAVAASFSVVSGAHMSLPIDPSATDNPWFRSPAVLPNPLNADVLSNQRTSLYNATTEEWHALTASSLPSHLDPWNGSATEMVFAIPDGGHDGGWTSILLPPVIEYPPFDLGNAITLTVRGDGECLRIRGKPGTTGEILGCLDDGADVTLATPAWTSPNITGDWPADQPFEGETVHYNRDDNLRFAYVSSRDLEGWVALDFLAWPSPH